MKTVYKNIANYFKNIFKKKNILFIGLPVVALAAAILFFSATVEKGKPLIAEYKKYKNHDTTITKPNVDIKVNREYDENGNMIRYDSSYTYSYSSSNIDPEEIDELINRFGFYTNPIKKRMDMFEEFWNYDPLKDIKDWEPKSFTFELGKAFFDEFEKMQRQDSAFIHDFVRHGIAIP